MNIDENKYNVVKEKNQHGVIKYIVTEKERCCESCNKLMERKAMQLIVWTDKDNYNRSLLVCRKCRVEAIEMFKETDTRFVQ